MAWAGFDGGTIGNLLSKWEEVGVFAYVLPFLVIFSLIFGILGQMKIFKNNKAVNVIIALAVALMALQFEFVPRFFSEVFPRLGIGLAVLLIVLILLGLFMDPDKPGLIWTLLGVGVVIVIVVLLNTTGTLGWTAGYWWEDNWSTILGLIVFLVILGFIIFSNSGGGSSSDKGAVVVRPYMER